MFVFFAAYHGSSDSQGFILVFQVFNFPLFARHFLLKPFVLFQNVLVLPFQLRLALYQFRYFCFQAIDYFKQIVHQLKESNYSNKFSIPEPIKQLF